ncbi:acetyltransferase [Burkholderia oklahomensis]|uniref:Acetyltransferase family protein n=1 Tax=Burkholderia oklahomensis TaxID=342113 RepID=A0AAI8FRD7_9BURK|nr:acetyltransferase [Burkholderia oklahomensis]AIO69837.1 acetyltransferase family protein [Burkholderia oklahomensis]AJX36104.1 acetyltransferase family protein [Burkholderia oklahomensis C6786]AOI39222.1 GNAT family acetyltransferase [Burkholderia oklahomensis EO147]AOI48911.1 GNAT family acetyltransferase [Burkholderia oklahomensis C6786]KUY50488.1 GNAT family acetyltransferase [Burkholderia oklahomensis C6786]
MSVRSRIPTDNPILLEIWKRSVRETHTFLREQDIEALYPQVRDAYLPNVTVWVDEAIDGRIAGFVGVDGAQVEMLFVEPELFGQGVGTRLLDHVRARHANLTVDVNEQNPQAHGFYRRYGFKDVGRSPTDSAGRPFPLIHMAY